jgi:hypothetical protein
MITSIPSPVSEPSLSQTTSSISPSLSLGSGLPQGADDVMEDDSDSHDSDDSVFGKEHFEIMRIIVRETPTQIGDEDEYLLEVRVIKEDMPEHFWTHHLEPVGVFIEVKKEKVVDKGLNSLFILSIKGQWKAQWALLFFSMNQFTSGDMRVVTCSSHLHHDWETPNQTRLAVWKSVSKPKKQYYSPFLKRPAETLLIKNLRKWSCTEIPKSSWIQKYVKTFFLHKGEKKPTGFMVVETHSIFANTEKCYIQAHETGPGCLFVIEPIGPIDKELPLIAGLFGY